MQALGLIETKGLIPAIECADAMLNAITAKNRNLKTQRQRSKDCFHILKKIKQKSQRRLYAS